MAEEQVSTMAKLYAERLMRGGQAKQGGNGGSGIAIIRYRTP